MRLVLDRARTYSPQFIRVSLTYFDSGQTAGSSTLSLLPIKIRLAGALREWSRTRPQLLVDAGVDQAFR